MLQLAGIRGSARRRSPAVAGIPGTGIPRLYAMGVVRQMLVQVLLILLLIEVIFLTEKLNQILRVAIDHKVGAGNVVMLLVYTAPQIFDLALPLALMIGVYRIVLRCREDRELLVLAGMGVGLHQLIGLAMAIGAGAMVISLLVSGSIDPRTRFAHRSVLFDAQHEALRGGITPGQFYFFGPYTVFAGPQTVATPERRLFVHHDQGETQRAIVAARARLSDPDEEGRMTLHLNDVVAQDFSVVAGSKGGAAACEGAGCEASAFHSAPVASMRLGRFAQDLTLEQLIRFEPRGMVPAEWTMGELAGVWAAPAERSTEHLSEFGRRFARALLCLLAPLMAGVTLALTTRGTQAFVLPAACAAVMSVDLASTRLADLLAQAGPVTLVVALTGLALVIGLALIKQAAVLQHAIIKPALARA